MSLGDLDPKGIDIPTGTSERRAARALRRIEPERHWYQWLLSHGLRCPCAIADPSSESEARAEKWLGTDLWTKMLGLFRCGQRIPQESLGFEQIAEADRAG